MAAQGAAGILYGNSTSYHHMCRFNSGMFFDHPLLQQYKWYWRVEPDVRFTCRITYDPFVAMSQHKKKYGYIMALWEIPETGLSIPLTSSPSEQSIQTCSQRFNWKEEPPKRSP